MATDGVVLDKDDIEIFWRRCGWTHCKRCGSKLKMDKVKIHHYDSNNGQPVYWVRLTCPEGYFFHNEIEFIYDLSRHTLSYYSLGGIFS
jgi:hypothetical protein